MLVLKFPFCKLGLIFKLLTADWTKQRLTLYSSMTIDYDESTANVSVQLYLVVPPSHLRRFFLLSFMTPD